MSIDWIFGEYKILKKIATGGMAEVFLAKRVGLKGFEKLLAIKRILPQFSQNEEFITMFIDEAKLAAQLTHRNIVQIYDFGNQQDSYYIAMEYVFGKDVRSILKKSRDLQRPLPVTQGVYVITGAAKGLEYAHALKDHYGKSLEVIHRDISPQNILVSYEGEVMVADFGIAKAASKSTETRAGVLKGKILYMSPEQAWGKPMDKRSDLYSLGVVLYEMIANRKIFDADSEFSMLEKVRNSEIEYPEEVFEKVPKPLSKIIRKALEKDPDDRYQTANEMRLDLENFLLTTKETLSEKMLSDYLKMLFRDEIEEERKVLTERVELPAEKTVLAEQKGEEPGRAPGIQKEPERIKQGKRKGFFIPIKDKFLSSDTRMKLGLIGALCLVGVFISFFLLTTDKSSTTVSSVIEKSTRPQPPIVTLPVPEIKSEQPREEPSTPEKKPSAPEEKPSPPEKKPSTAEKKPSPSPSPSPAPSPSPEKHKAARLPYEEKEKGTKEGIPTDFLALVEQGPRFLRENKYMNLLEEIRRLSNKERQDINIRILESFALLKKWVLLKDKGAKNQWESLYQHIEATRNKSATPLLIQITKDPEEWTRLYAVSLLRTNGDRRALNDLQRIAANDPNWRVRHNAGKAISAIQSSTASPPSGSPPSK